MYIDIQSFELLEMLTLPIVTPPEPCVSHVSVAILAQTFENLLALSPPLLRKLPYTNCVSEMLLMWIMMDSICYLVPRNPFFMRLQVNSIEGRRFSKGKGKGVKGKGKGHGNVKVKLEPEPEPPIGLDKFGKPVFWSAVQVEEDAVTVAVEEDAVTVAGREVENAGRELRVALRRLADRRSSFAEMTVARAATPCRLRQALQWQARARARARRYVQ